MSEASNRDNLPQFIVMGAGAIGCYLGARLTLGGFGVSLVGRPRTIEPIRATGLRVSDLGGFNAVIASSQLQTFVDLASAKMAIEAAGIALARVVVLLCVKGGATISAAQEIAANFGPDLRLNIPIISMQNGVGNVARIARHVPHAQVLAGMVPYNVAMFSDAAELRAQTQMQPTIHVRRGVNGSIAMQRSPVTQNISTHFTAAGLPNRLHDDMVSVQWGKLLLNLNNPVNAIANLPLLLQLKDWHYRRVLAALQLEALALLKHAQIKPIKAGLVDPAVLPRILQLPNFLFERVAAKFLLIDPAARSSMWDDIQRGNQTEVADLCGAVVQLASDQGRRAPRNALMCELVNTLRKGDSMSGIDLWRKLK